MSDSNTVPAPAPVPSPDPYFETLNAYDALHASLTEPNKAALLAALATAGISHVVVGFDGCGDSGQIEGVEAKAGDDVVLLPDTQVGIAVASWGEALPATREMSLTEAIERLAYDYLGDAHAGWENNDGAYGEFVFDVAAGAITLDHNDRYTAVESYSHTF